MPKTLAAAELARLLSLLSHPHRIQIVEELRLGEQDVNHLQQALGVSHSRVSQHLAKMRAQRVVSERREGRHVFYHLKHPELASWLSQGLTFLEAELREAEEMRSVMEKARHLWSEEPRD
ncbi:MAG: helix-turn-helix transcriptional regulator [Myxococcales bacterium]|nr:helix-turn-helix transcriptional regulator [Myxococcales bacterium]